MTALCLLASPAPAGAQTSDTTLSARRAQAERLRREERFPEALAAYQAVASSEGSTREDRFWVAKLESWTGRLADAEAGIEYYGEHVDGQPSTHGTTLTIGDRSGRLHWRGTLTVQDKFARTESRVGGEMAFRATPRLELRARALGAPQAEVFPRGTYGVGVGGALGRLVLGADYAVFDYLDANVHQVGPDAELYLARHWLAAARYRYASTSFSAGGPAVGNHGGSFTLAWLYGSANLVRLFGGVGGESFAGPSRELVGSFDARTAGVAWRHYVDPRLGLELLYARQDRSTGQGQDSWSFGLVQRW